MNVIYILISPKPSPSKLFFPLFNLLTLYSLPPCSSCSLENKTVHTPINMLALLGWGPGLWGPKLCLKQVLAQEKDQPLGKPRTGQRARLPTCSPPCGHSAGSSPLRGSGSRQSDRGPHTLDSSKGTCVCGSAGGHRNCTGWAAASGTLGKSRKEHQESSSCRCHGPVALQSGARHCLDTGLNKPSPNLSLPTLGLLGHPTPH